MEALPLGVGPQTLGGLPWQRRTVFRRTQVRSVTLRAPLSHTVDRIEALESLQTGRKRRISEAEM